MSQRFSHNRSKRSVLDDKAYEDSLSFVSEKGKRFAGQIVSKQTRKDVGMQPAMGGATNQSTIGGGLMSLSNAPVAVNNGEATTIVLHDHIAVFAPAVNATAAPRDSPTTAASPPSSPSAPIQPLTPSQLLIKFIGYLPTRWLDAMVKAILHEQHRQQSIKRDRSSSNGGRGKDGSAAAGAGASEGDRDALINQILHNATRDYDEDLFHSRTNGGAGTNANHSSLYGKQEGFAAAYEQAEEEAQTILGLGIADQTLKAARRESNLSAQRQATALAVDALNQSAVASGGGGGSLSVANTLTQSFVSMANSGAVAAQVVGSGSTDGMFSTLVRSVSSTASPLSVLDTFLTHKQLDAANRAVATYGAIRAEQTRVMAMLKEQRHTLNLTIKSIAAAEESKRVEREQQLKQQRQRRILQRSGFGSEADDGGDDAAMLGNTTSHGDALFAANNEHGLSPALAAEREHKIAHTTFMLEVEARFKAAQLMATIAHLVHKRANEAKALVVLLRLFRIVAEDGIAEESGWQAEQQAIDKAYTGGRREEQSRERSFMAQQNRSAMSVRELLRRDGGGGGGGSQNGQSPRSPKTSSMPESFSSFSSASATTASKKAGTTHAQSLIRSRIPSSASALAAKWKLRYEQRKDAVMRTVVREVLLPFLLGRDVGALRTDGIDDILSSGGGDGSGDDGGDSLHNKMSSFELLHSSALHLLFDMFPSQSDGQPMTATAMSVVSASNALYNSGNNNNSGNNSNVNDSNGRTSLRQQSSLYNGRQSSSAAANLLGGLPTTNLLHLGLLLDAEQGIGPTALTEAGDEVRMPWWYIESWHISKRQGECLKLWQRFRPTSVPSSLKIAALPPINGSPDVNNNTNNNEEEDNEDESLRDSNEDLLPTAAPLFKRLYYSHKNVNDCLTIATSAMSASVGADGFDSSDVLHALMLCQQWAGTVDDRDNHEELIPTNTFPPLRPFLSFPFHVTVKLSEPAKATLKNVLAPFVDEFWARVATTNAAEILAERGAREERQKAARAAAAEAARLLYGDSGSRGGSIFGEFVGGGPTGNTPDKNNNNAEGVEDGGCDDKARASCDTESAIPSGSTTSRRQNAIAKPPSAKEIEERRQAALGLKEQQRLQRAEEAKQAAIARQKRFEEQQRRALNKEATQLAKIANVAQEQTVEKEARTAALNDPIIKARERLQQQIEAASRLYTQHESAAPDQMPPRPEPVVVEEDRSQDFHYVTNKVRRPLDEAGLVAKFLGGGISGGAVTSEKNGGDASRIANNSNTKSHNTKKPTMKKSPRKVTVKKTVVTKKINEDGIEAEVEEEMLVEEEQEQEEEEEVERNFSDNEGEDGGSAAGVNTTGFTFEPTATSVAQQLSPRNYPKHLFATDPYLAEAIAHLEDSLAQQHTENAAEAEQTRRKAHAWAAEQYHQNVMERVIENRMQDKLESRRRAKERAAMAMAEEVEAQSHGMSVSFIPQQDDSRVDSTTGQFVARPISEVTPVGYEHFSNRTAIARLYKNLGILGFEPEPAEARDGVVASVLMKSKEGEAAALLAGNGPLSQSKSVASTAASQQEARREKEAAEKALAAKSFKTTIFTQFKKPRDDNGSGGAEDGCSSSAPPNNNGRSNNNAPSLVHAQQPTRVVVQDYTTAVHKALAARDGVAKPPSSRDSNQTTSAAVVSRNGSRTSDAVMTVNKRRALTAEKEIGMISFQPASVIK